MLGQVLFYELTNSDGGSHVVCTVLFAKLAVINVIFPTRTMYAATHALEVFYFLFIL